MKLPTLSERGKWMLAGAVYALAACLVLALMLGGWVVYIRSLHGQMAYEYIQTVIAQQQKATPPTTSQPPEKPTP